jgi:hypothetical protein
MLESNKNIDIFQFNNRLKVDKRKNFAHYTVGSLRVELPYIME